MPSSLNGRATADAARAIIRDFAGTLVCDGYTAYHALQKQGAQFRIAHCWAHVRRKYIEAEDTSPAAAREILDHRSDVCRRASDEGSTPERSATCTPNTVEAVMHEIQAWTLARRTLPQSALGKAIGYMSSLWPGLQVFLSDAAVRPDNNAVERALRGVVVGSKNHYGSRSKRSTEVAALFYSLIESARSAGHDPDYYLKAAVSAALDHELIPLPHELPLPA